MLTLARLIAGFFGCGRLPVTPGTGGSLAALLLGIPLLLLPGWALPLAILLATLSGLWAIKASGADDDPGWVVIDEVAGQWIALLGLTRPSVTGLAVAFLLFRVLDVTKLGPIGWADRQHGPLGVMLDDVLAGAATTVFLWTFRLVWPGILD